VEENEKVRLKFEALTKEYSWIRRDATTYDILKIICITLSSLIFIIMFIASISFQQYILIFISPLFSIFFVLLTLAMQVYSITLGLRASQIEEILKDIIGEPTIQFEASVGIFGSAAGDVLTTQVGKYYLMFALLVVVVGIAPIIIGLIYAFIEFYRDVGYFAWFVVGLDAFAGIVTFYLGYRFFFKRGWEKLKLSL